MNNFKLTTPVAFIIFNRPDTTERVFAEIRRAKPTKLLVVADGPRSNRPGEAEKCAQARAIINKVDWECEVLKNYSDENMGCGARVSTGISWVFEQVEEAIILEDDCLPHQSFFQFCQELLEKYRFDDRIMQISGDNCLFGKERTEYSYYFSMFSNPVLIWGWASWRRAWEKYDYDIKLWPQIRDRGMLKSYFGNNRLSDNWTRIFNEVYDNKFTWDYQWTFCRWIQNGLCIVPNQNLVSNIGWRSDATHTKIPNTIWDNIPCKEMDYPLKHPPYILCNYDADRFVLKNAWPSLIIRIYLRLKRELYKSK